ncbi:hypothetical protein YC2023_064611 [Brassica napus]
MEGDVKKAVRYVVRTAEVTLIALVAPPRCLSFSPIVHCHSHLKNMGSAKPLITEQDCFLLQTIQALSASRKLYRAPIV